MGAFEKVRIKSEYAGRVLAAMTGLRPMHLYLHGLAKVLLMFGEFVKILGAGESSKELACKPVVRDFGRLTVEAR